MRPDGRPSGPGKPRGARLFFALFPPPELARDLVRQATSLVAGGRGVAARNLHLTLAFLGELPLDRLPALTGIAKTVAGRHQAFSLDLDRLGYWRRKEILWLGCRQVPPALPALVADLVGALHQAGLPAPPEHQDFVPHLTLARKLKWADGELPEPAPVSWNCSRLCLVRSRLGHSGSEYETLAAWPLEPDS